MPDQTTPVKRHASRLTSVCWFAIGGWFLKLVLPVLCLLLLLPCDFGTRKNNSNGKITKYGSSE